MLNVHKIITAMAFAIVGVTMYDVVKSNRFNSQVAFLRNWQEEAKRLREDEARHKEPTDEKA